MRLSLPALDGSALHAALRWFVDRVTWRVSPVRDELSASPLMTPALLVLILVALVPAVRGSRLASLALVPLAVAWTLFNTTLEGPVLLPLTRDHGVTGSDLLSLTALAVAGWRLVPEIRSALSAS